jgi:hypothetical protein
VRTALAWQGAAHAQVDGCKHERLRASGIEALLVSIDGGPSIDIFADRYLAVSPQMAANLPEDNILGVPAQATTFVAAGWVAMIRPLPPGTHTIRVESVQSGNDFVSEAIVEVVPGRR